MSPETKYCRSCGAAIIWATSWSGKRMPVDAEPVEEGNLRLFWPDDDPVPYVEYTANEAPQLFPGNEDGLRYTSHFSTCPEANDWRKA